MPNLPFCPLSGRTSNYLSKIRLLTCHTWLKTAEYRSKPPEEFVSLPFVLKPWK
jgi:hypothetical protein